MAKKLTAAQQRWLDIAIAVATADGEVAKREKHLLAYIVGELGLEESELEALLESPRALHEAIEGEIGQDERLDLYSFAARVVTADGVSKAAESEVLQQLAQLLELSDNDVKYAALAAGPPT